MRLVNGYVCRNCGDEALAKKGIDPAHPKRAASGNEAYVSSAEASRNRSVRSPIEAAKKLALGVNHPESSGEQGRALNLYA